MTIKLMLLSVFFLGPPCAILLVGLVYMSLKRSRAVHRIYKIPLADKQLQKELSRALPVILTHTTIAAIFLFSDLIPILVSTSIITLLLSIAATLVIQEVWYYFSHWFMHKNKLLWRAHRPHHRSIVCSGVTGISFSVGEKIIFSGGIFSLYAVVALIIPLSFAGLASAYLIYFTIAASSHQNVETFPAHFNRIPLLRFLGTSTFHALHHTYPGTNFGLYTRLFDRIFHTEHPHYEALYTKCASEHGLTQR